MDLKKKPIIWENGTYTDALEGYAHPMLLDGFLPLGKVALLAGEGGIGKGYLVMQMISAITIGAPFLGKIAVLKTGKVLFISDEDDRNEVAFRFNHLKKNMPMESFRKLQKNFFRCDTSGEGGLFTREHGKRDTTRLFASVKAAAEEFHPVLIIIDTLADMASAFDEINNGDMTFVAAKLRELSTAAGGATVLLTHHLNKASFSNDSLPTLADIRGATAIINSTRWVSVLREDMLAILKFQNGRRQYHKIKREDLLWEWTGEIFPSEKTCPKAERNTKKAFIVGSRVENGRKR